jgi:hypothetical protein
MKEPLHELGRTLLSRRMDAPDTPYRGNHDIDNLLDNITFGVRPKDPVLVVSLGLDAGARGTAFEFCQTHVHRSGEMMRPDALLGHSSAEGGGNVKIAIMEELSILAATMLRELGKDCYLSVIRSADGANLSGIALISEGRLDSFTIRGNHPPVSSLTIFEDAEALNVLRLLRAHNGLRLLYDEVKDKSRLASADLERYKGLMADFAIGAGSAHHLVRLVEDVYLAFASRFPDVMPDKN